MVIIGQDPYHGPKQAHGTFRLILQNPFIFLPFLPPFLPREGGGLGFILSAVEFSPTASDWSLVQASASLFPKGFPSHRHWSM